MIRVGCAGWAIPRAVRAAFPEDGSALQRYAAVFNAVEINTTFYRPHRRQTFERWAQTTPEGFRFAVKAPRSITHERRLVDAADLVESFLTQVEPLSSKLGPVLLQLPPSLVFDATVAGAFFGTLRSRCQGEVVCEPRHASWFTPEAETLMRDHGVGRVAADPPPAPGAATPGGAPSTAYWRLHGSPRMYYSAYESAFLDRLADQVEQVDVDGSWCIFDNTASGAAATDAIDLHKRLIARILPL